MKISPDALRAWVAQADTDREYPFIPEQRTESRAKPERPQAGAFRNAFEIRAFGKSRLYCVTIPP